MKFKYDNVMLSPEAIVKVFRYKVSWLTQTRHFVSSEAKGSSYILKTVTS